MMIKVFEPIAASGLAKESAARHRTPLLHALGTATVVAIATLLLGCGSSKPGVSEIEGALEASYRCTPLVVKAVKKLDGASVSENLYDVSFAYQLEFKGGPQGALDYFSRTMRLGKEIQESKLNRNSVPEYEMKAFESRLRKLSEELDSLQRGDCKSPAQNVLVEPLQLIGQLHSILDERLKADVGPIPIPYRAKMSATARARKAESGWVIFQATFPNIEEVENSEPQRIDR